MGKPEGGNGGNGGNKPEKPEKPEGGNGGNGGNKPEKPEGGNGGNKPEKPEKPNKPGGNKPNKPMSCDVATNWPCLMKGDVCVEGTDGATCQEAETNMTMPCSGLTMPDVWSMIGCAGQASSSMKSKECKESCMGDTSSLVTCTECVATLTPCLQAALGSV